MVAILDLCGGGRLIPFRGLRTLFDPTLDQVDFGIREPRIFRRHARRAVRAENGVHQKTIGRLAGDDCFAGVATLNQALCRIDPVPRFLSFRPMTAATALSQQGLDLGEVIDRFDRFFTAQTIRVRKPQNAASQGEQSWTMHHTS